MKFSRDIDILDVKHNVLMIKIKKPHENMQEDASCFEAVALLLKAEDQSRKIELDFDLSEFDSVNNSNYMRFLYRVNRFNNAFEWFEVSKEGLVEVERFNEFINGKNLFINTPEEEAKYNVEKGLEHCIENRFVKSEQNYLFELVKEKTGGDMKSVYNQLPNGLFYDKVSNKTRIFPTGYFDLWGTSENNELYLFELKTPQNKKMGIISELFFYASYLKDFYFDSEFNNNDSKYRGFLEIKKLKHPKIIACFLTNGLHSGIDKYKSEILSMLNSIDLNIKFYFIEYKSEIADENTYL